MECRANQKLTSWLIRLCDVTSVKRRWFNGPFRDVNLGCVTVVGAKLENRNSIPIHDCLMVTPDHVEETKRAIEDAAQEVLGFTPKVNVTDRRKG